MAIAVLQEPYEELSGSLSKNDAYYVRNFRGHCVFQHKPRRCSEQQRQMRQAFGLQYGTARKRQRDVEDT